MSAESGIPRIVVLATTRTFSCGGGANGIASTETTSPRVGSIPAAAETTLRIFATSALVSDSSCG